LTLQDASEQEAALAVLQSLYAVEPLLELLELLSQLSQEQQLQAAVLADKWQVPHVSSAAAQMLADAAHIPGALVKAVQQRVLQDAALPDCLQPLLKSVLMFMFGDLEAVWADAELQQQLLALSLPAMELLLSCGSLQVGQTSNQYSSVMGSALRTHVKTLVHLAVRCAVYHVTGLDVTDSMYALDQDCQVRD
jgi:hypothetical protein